MPNSNIFHHLTKIPSVNKGKHACQRVFPSLFVLFALAGARPPASQKPKIARISIAGRCGQFCRSRNASRQGKARREYCRIVKGLDAVWAYFCPSKPCLPLSTDGSITFARCSQVMMYINLYSPLYVLSLALIAAAREYPTTISAKFKIRSSTSKLSLTIGCIASTPMSHQY